MKQTRKIKTVLSILKNEIRGDAASALQKLSKDYTMTWMYKGKKKLFPSTKPNFKTELREAYRIKGRTYEIKNIAEGTDVVMVELVESYPDSKTKKIYRTPLVIVIEMKGGRIVRGRHYCDPAISHLVLSRKEIEKNFRGVKTKIKLV
ncbi:MAG: nuclear transport factor 2 family protein [Minisyncoccota bacterium]